MAIFISYLPCRNLRTAGGRRRIFIFRTSFTSGPCYSYSRKLEYTGRFL